MLKFILHLEFDGYYRWDLVDSKGRIIGRSRPMETKDKSVILADIEMVKKNSLHATTEERKQSSAPNPKSYRSGPGGGH